MEIIVSKNVTQAPKLNTYHTSKIGWTDWMIGMVCKEQQRC